MRSFSKKWPILLFTGFLVTAGWLLFWPLDLFRAPYATVLKAEDGTLLGARIADDGQWRFPATDSVNGKFEKAIIRFEDRYFYYHPGINPVSIFRAAWQNFQAGKIVSGGSTLSMQVIRLARHQQPRTYLEKFIELMLAVKLEIHHSKEEILQMYASHAPFGGNVVGINAAAWRYFGRSSFNLSWAENALLAVLPNAPSLIYPGKNHHELKEKRNRLLDKLYREGTIDSLTNILAQKEPIPARPEQLPVLAPHLLTRNIKEGHKGAQITTTLQPGLQNYVTRIVNRQYDNLKENGIFNAAAMVMEVSSGKVLAYVGNTSGDSKESHGEDVDIITAKRSTGSILKPFLYASMLHEGKLLPTMLVKDIPTHMDGFVPQNFNKKFNGAVPADKALSRSLNVPAVHMLKDYGVPKLHHKLAEMGMGTLNKPPGHYGLSLILGGAEASLWDLTGMYASLGRILKNYFKYPEPRRYNRADIHAPYFIKPAKARKSMSGQGKLNAGAIWYTFKAMTELHRPENETGWEYFNSSRKVAWKTGTSYGFRDAWAIGVTPEYVVGVWAGNADGEGRPGLTGIRAAAPILFDIFKILPETSWFTKPGSDIKRISICEKSGHRAGKDCKSTVMEGIPQAPGQTKVCPFCHPVHLDRKSNYRVTRACAGTLEMKTEKWFTLPAVQEWYYQLHNADYQKLPPFKPGCRNAEGTKVMQVIYPEDGSSVYIPKEIEGKKGKAIFEVAHRDRRSTIYWHIDENFIGKTQNMHQKAIVCGPGWHQLTLVDENGATLTQSFQVLGKKLKN